MRVRFTATSILETRGRNDGPVFEAGSIHDLAEASAQRWIRRGVAEPAPDPEPELEPEAEPELEPEPEPEPEPELEPEPEPERPRSKFARR